MAEGTKKRLVMKASRLYIGGVNQAFMLTDS